MSWERKKELGGGGGVGVSGKLIKAVCLKLVKGLRRQAGQGVTSLENSLQRRGREWAGGSDGEGAISVSVVITRCENDAFPELLLWDVR